MRRKGWFAIPGVQEGDRTLDEQLAGLEVLRANVAGRRVVDFGSAEGLIAERLLDDGAAFVRCVDSVPGHLEVARARLDPVRSSTHLMDLNDRAAAKWLAAVGCDVLLLLAIIHKLREPDASLVSFLAPVRERVAIRLPRESSGRIRSKHFSAWCDVPARMREGGFALEDMRAGPRAEMVQIWRRT